MNINQDYQEIARDHEGETERLLRKKIITEEDVNGYCLLMRANLSSFPINHEGNPQFSRLFRMLQEHAKPLISKVRERYEAQGGKWMTMEVAA